MQSLANDTLCAHWLDDSRICLPTSDFPFYYSPRSSLLSSISDHNLTLAAPFAAYWSLSLFFHLLDISGWKWLDKYRHHDSAEVSRRNMASRRQVVLMVLFQQLIQTVLGLWWISDEAGAEGVSHSKGMEIIAGHVASVLRSVAGLEAGDRILQWQGAQIVYFVYWWAIPVAQFLLAMFFIDTWQYFLHRYMHINKWMYKQFHSVHHRLYVPYAFGSLYNHPVEGFLLDTVGAIIAESVTAMNTRQAMLLFAFSTLKTVDDHCGYSLPFDPLQLFTANTADYHDIHHQVVGFKSNFSQPFFIHWDVLLGTRMTRQDIEQRKELIREKTN